MKFNEPVLAMLQNQRKKSTSDRRRKVAVQAGKTMCVQPSTSQDEQVATSQDEPIVSRKKRGRPSKQLPVSHLSEEGKRRKKRRISESSDEKLNYDGLLKNLSGSDDSEEGDSYRQRVVLEEFEAEQQADKVLGAASYTGVLLVMFRAKKSVKYYVG